MDKNVLYKMMDRHNEYLEREAVESAESIIHSLFQKTFDELNTDELDKLRTAVEEYNQYFPIVVGFNELLSSMEEDQ